MNTLKIKINKPLYGYAAKTIIQIATDTEGVPLDRFWRDRLRDSDIDDCIEIVKKQKPKDQPKTSPEKI